MKSNRRRFLNQYVGYLCISEQSVETTLTKMFGALNHITKQLDNASDVANSQASPIEEITAILENLTESSDKLVSLKS